MKAKKILINQYSDILNNKKSIDKSTVFRDTFSSPLKKLKRKFEKEYLTIQLKKIMEIFQKLQILLEWIDQLCIEN